MGQFTLAFLSKITSVFILMHDDAEFDTVELFRDALEIMDILVSKDPNSLQVKHGVAIWCHHEKDACHISLAEDQSAISQHLGKLSVGKASPENRTASSSGSRSHGQVTSDKRVFQPGRNYATYSSCRPTERAGCLTSSEVQQLCLSDPNLKFLVGNVASTISILPLNDQAAATLVRNQQFERTNFRYSSEQNACLLDFTVAGVVMGESIRKTYSLKVLTFRVMGDGEIVAALFDIP